VLIPNLRDDCRTFLELKLPHSKTIFVVVSSMAVVLPPITPAIEIAISFAVIT
jgi:hypothetical protein